MKITRFLRSYLQTKDITRDTPVTITSVEIEEVGQEKEERVVVYLKELDLAYIPNTTSCNALADMFSDETDNWIGKQFILYADPNVMFKGKRIGGLRVRPIDS